MANITRVNIDNSEMPPAETTRLISIGGEAGAKVMVLVFDISVGSSAQHKYYDWNSQAFEDGHNDSHNNLTLYLRESSTENVNVYFPSGGGTYVIKILPLEGTKILNKNSYTLQLSKQASNATLTFTPISLGSSSNYATLPTKTSTGAPGDTNVINFSFDVTNVSNDSHGFGLKLSDIITLSSKNWYFTTTENILDNPAGDGEDSQVVQVSDLSDLGIGSELIYHKATTSPVNKAGDSLSGVRITSLDLLNSTIKFNQAVAFEDGETMTFRAYGKQAISNAIGVTLGFGSVEFLPTKLTKTIRAGSSSTTINLNGTYGIAGGNTVTISGLGIDNSSNNAVTSVSASSSAGSIVVQNSQSGLTTGSTITFKGCNQIINISGSIKIGNYPTANKTIYLDLDKFITVGAAL